MAADDWRIRIEVADDEAGGLLDRLGLELGGEARELARQLEARRLAVSRDGDEVFVYAGSRAEAARAQAVIQAELRAHDIEARSTRLEHWLAEQDRWDDEPADEGWEEDALERGYAPWEVRIELPTHEAARDLGEQLEGEGRRVERRWQYVIVGTASKEEADALAARLHGEVEPGGELVWATVPGNPFAVFGGLAG